MSSMEFVPYRFQVDEPHEWLRDVVSRIKSIEKETEHMWYALDIDDMDIRDEEEVAFDPFRETRIVALKGDIEPWKTQLKEALAGDVQAKECALHISHAIEVAIDGDRQAFHRCMSAWSPPTCIEGWAGHILGVKLYQAPYRARHRVADAWEKGWEGRDGA